MPGRPRKPAALRTGHHANQEERQHEIKMEKFLGGKGGISLEPPKELNPSAKWYYRFIVTGMKDTGVLLKLDRFVVVQTAICLSRMRECDKIIDKQGLILYRVTKNGYKIPYEHPAVNELNKYSQQFKTLSTQLGLSPSSRSKLASVDVDSKMKKQDPLNKIMNQVPKDLDK